jgi:anti-anti-sigma regulatory factor
MGGELHPLKYGSYFNDKNKLFEIIKAEEEFILNSSGRNNRKIWIDLYETVIDEEVAEILVRHLQTIRHKIFRLSLVGCSPATQKNIKIKMKQIETDLLHSTKYFDDPEIAKQWLLGKLKH